MTLPAVDIRQVSDAGNRAWRELHTRREGKYTVRQVPLRGFDEVLVGIAH
jgi:hypothetical protein